MEKTILITGCSSGIGEALAREFHRRGHRVYATARRRDSLAALEAQGLRGLVLDVDDDASIAAAIEAVRQEAGQLDLLVNNAGVPGVGAALDLARDDLRRIYETNVIAPVRMTAAALPLLRAAVAARGSATLANVGSIVGVVATPFAAAYCSSKAALHSLTESLRMELAPFGIHVTCIQPGGVRSRFGEHAEEGICLPEGSAYKAAERGIRARARAGQVGATPAAEFVVPVADKLLRERPPRVIRGGANSVRLPLLKRLLPPAKFDARLSRMFRLNLLG